MRPSVRQLRQWTAVAGTLAIAAGTGSAILGDGSDATLSIAGFTVVGDVVQVTVLNRGEDELTGTVFVRVMLQDREMGAASSVTVSGGNKVFVEIPMPAPVRAVIDLGVVLDDGSPF